MCVYVCVCHTHWMSERWGPSASVTVAMKPTGGLTPCDNTNTHTHTHTPIHTPTADDNTHEGTGLQVRLQDACWECIHHGIHNNEALVCHMRPFVLSQAPPLKWSLASCGPPTIHRGGSVPVCVRTSLDVCMRLSLCARVCVSSRTCLAIVATRYTSPSPDMSNT